MPTKLTSLVLTLLIGAGAVQASEGGHAGWQRSADIEIANLASLQRGARNFMAYCSGCHSLKYARYSRIAEDLKISDELRDQYLVKPGAKFTDYVRSAMPENDAIEWFGKVPPDLSLVARSRSPDWIFSVVRTGGPRRGRSLDSASCSATRAASELLRRMPNCVSSSFETEISYGRSPHSSRYRMTPSE